MLVYKTIKEIKEHVSAIKSEDRTIGFVPTMGALHQGHISLINTSKGECDITIASIFVNPTQFNDKSDLENYPRTTESDIRKLEDAGCDVLFLPSVIEMYPENFNEELFDLGNLDKVMEGKYRPGHFNGVVTIVSKFFDIILPNKSFFGEKDFQQLAIIKYIVKHKNYPIEIVSCPTLREHDGLAMSSRNMLLEPKERRIAGYIHHTMVEAKKLIPELSVDKIQDWVRKKINDTALMKVEYFDIVNSETLVNIRDWKDNCDKTGCIAVKIGKIRLIDNIKYNL